MPSDPLLGKMLMGHIELVAVAGHGATGTVYRATQAGMGRSVAVKVLRPERFTSPAAVSRFLQDARAAARLSHPNIVTVHLVGETDTGVPYIVMEFLDGQLLDALLQPQRALGPRRTLRIARQITAALAEAHSHGIIHRALKPENIFIVDKRRDPDLVKVLDFAIASVLYDAGDGNAAAPFGPPHYRAPEQAAGADVDARADLYALGVIMFRMATGHLPFEAASAREVIQRQATEPPISPRRLSPGISPALETIILRALATRPQERWQDADALLASLDAALAEGDGEPARTVLGVAPAAQTGWGAAPSQATPMGPAPSPPPVPLPMAPGASSPAVVVGAAPAVDTAGASLPSEGSPVVQAGTPERIRSGEALHGEASVAGAAQAADQAISVSAPYAQPRSIDDAQPARPGGGESDEDVLAPRRRSPLVVWWAALAAVVLGGVSGAYYAWRTSASTHAGAASPTAPLEPQSPGGPQLFEERLITEGAYALRLGFTAPPREGEPNLLKLIIQRSPGDTAQATAVTLGLRDAGGHEQTLSLRSWGGFYAADVNFKNAGRYLVKLSLVPPRGPQLQTSVTVDVADGLAKPARERGRRRGGQTDGEHVDVSKLPMTVVPTDPKQPMVPAAAPAAGYASPGGATRSASPAVTPTPPAAPSGAAPVPATMAAGKPAAANKPSPQPAHTPVPTSVAPNPPAPGAVEADDPYRILEKNN